VARPAVAPARDSNAHKARRSTKSVPESALSAFHYRFRAVRELPGPGPVAPSGTQTRTKRAGVPNPYL